MRLEFDNTFVRSLPEDPNGKNHRRQVHAACYSRVCPTKVSAPRLIAYSKEMADTLGLSEADVRSRRFLEVFSGNALLPEMEPFAACYGGHQFGAWAGQLGDGRAISLGEVIGTDQQRWELQLKGAGPTPYSRSADGRAVMRSSVREFLCSEAMHHLGIPTTRALCLLGTGDRVVRDMFYDGNPRAEPGAVVCRVAQSFVRFGNLEIFTHRGDFDTLKTLFKFTIERHFPDLLGSNSDGVTAPSDPLGRPKESLIARWFERVCRSSAELVAQWMRVGFVHGVLNTDNMSVLGLTIDYGPYGWLEDHDFRWTPNTTDASGRRYAFGRQPAVVGWNLERLGEALIPLGIREEPLNDGLAAYADTFEARYRSLMAAKLGLFGPRADAADQGPHDRGSLIARTHEVLSVAETDMTLFYRNLSRVNPGQTALRDASDAELVSPLLPAYYKPSELTETKRARVAAWLRDVIRWVEAAGTDPEERRRRMNGANPKYVLRNYLAQLAIDRAEEGDGSQVDELLTVLRRPYDEQPEHENYAEKRPEWARHRAGCSMLSCSS